MISGKLAALCLCPALVATPAVIATHPKMRHAVAHIMHRAADRLEAPVIAAAEPIVHCPSRYADDSPGGNGPSSEPSAGLSSLLSQDMSALQNTPFLTQAGSSFASAGPGFSSSPVSGIGGPGFGTVPADNVPDNGPGVVTPPTQAEGVTEPQNWALLVTGFAVTGLLLRNKRLKAA